METTFYDTSPPALLKRKSTTREEILDEKKGDMEKAVGEVTESSVLGDDETDVDSTIITKAEDVAVKVRTLFVMAHCPHHILSVS